MVGKRSRSWRPFRPPLEQEGPCHRDEAAAIDRGDKEIVGVASPMQCVVDKVVYVTSLHTCSEVIRRSSGTTAAQTLEPTTLEKIFSQIKLESNDCTCQQRKDSMRELALVLRFLSLKNRNAVITRGRKDLVCNPAGEWNVNEIARKKTNKFLGVTFNQKITFAVLPRDQDRAG